MAFSDFFVGASHEKDDLPCEDYADSYEENGCAALVVSDGHGNSLSFRAADGAKMACESTLNILKQYTKTPEDVLNVIEKSEERFFFNLKGLVLSSWLEKVLRDYESRPFTDFELNSLKKEDREYLLSQSDRFSKAYGCTLIAAFITSGFWFCIQIGDGTCTVSYDDGMSLQPLPDGADQFANISNSLCQSEAMQKFVHYFEKKEPLGIFIASDGVDESYPPLSTSLKLPCFYREISEPFFKKEEDAQKSLLERLERLTKEGSGDDVSVAVAINSETFLAEPKASLEQLKNLLETTELLIEGKRSSIQNNANALQQVEREYGVNKEELQKIADEIERIKQIKTKNENDLQVMLDEKKWIESQINT